MDKIGAGLLAAVPLAVVLVTYSLVRGKALATFFKGTDTDLGKISDGGFYWIIQGVFVLMALVFGLVSGLVYGWLGLPWFRIIAFGAALAFSLLAAISRTPLARDKIVWNLAIGGIMGGLVPILSG